MQLEGSKFLIEDVSNQKKTPTLAIIACASNYYYRVEHFFACLIAQCFGLNFQCILLLFKAMQSMNMFLQTAHDTSSTSYSSSRLTLFQLFAQVNGTVPVLWIIISINLVRDIYLKVFSTPQCSPMSNLIFNLIELMHVDDTNLDVLNIEGKFTLELIELGQRMLDSWQFALSISGGDLKLNK